MTPEQMMLEAAQSSIDAITVNPESAEHGIDTEGLCMRFSYIQGYRTGYIRGESALRQEVERLRLALEQIAQEDRMEGEKTDLYALHRCKHTAQVTLSAVYNPTTPA